MASQQRDGGAFLRIPDQDGDAEVGGASAWTFASTGVLLDRREYRNLFLRHLLSLIPALGLVVGVALAARAVPCELSAHRREDAEDAADRCDQALHANLTLAASFVGGVAWLAAWSLRSASWTVASYFAAFPDIGHAEIDPIATSLVSISLRTACHEGLRLFSLAVGYALFIAEISVNPQFSHHGSEPDAGVTLFTSHFRLRPQDPRFSIAMWVSLGWAVAETVAGCVQILQQLSLYAPPLDPPALPDDPDPMQGIGMPLVLTRTSTGPSIHLPAASAHPMSAAPSTATSPRRRLTAEEDPSSQLEQARDELARLTRREIPRYDGTQSTEPSLSRNASKDRTRSVSTERPEVSAEDTAAAPTTTSIPLINEELEEPQPDEEDAKDLEEEIQRNFEDLLQARQRAELQDTLGIPLPDVPVALCLLWRIDGVLFNVGATLIVASALALGQGSLDAFAWHLRKGTEHTVPLLPALDTYATNLVAIFLVHVAISSVWQLSVPRFGFALVTYSSLLIALGLVLIGLASWGALV